MIVYGIPSCDSCRKAMKFMRDRGIAHRFHDVRVDGLDIQMLERWAGQLGWEKLVNRRSQTWRRIPENLRQGMNHDKAMAALLENPTLLKRPVLEADGFLAIGFSETRFSNFLERSA